MYRVGDRVYIVDATGISANILFTIVKVNRPHLMMSPIGGQKAKQPPIKYDLEYISPSLSLNFKLISNVISLKDRRKNKVKRILGV